MDRARRVLDIMVANGKIINPKFKLDKSRMVFQASCPCPKCWPDDKKPGIVNPSCKLCKGRFTIPVQVPLHAIREMLLAVPEDDDEAPVG